MSTLTRFRKNSYNYYNANIKGIPYPSKLEGYMEYQHLNVPHYIAMGHIDAVIVFTDVKSEFHRRDVCSLYRTYDDQEVGIEFLEIDDNTFSVGTSDEGDVIGQISFANGKICEQRFIIIHCHVLYKVNEDKYALSLDAVRSCLTKIYTTFINSDLRFAVDMFNDKYLLDTDNTYQNLIKVLIHTYMPSMTILLYEKSNSIFSFISVDKTSDDPVREINLHYANERLLPLNYTRDIDNDEVFKEECIIINKG